MAHGIELTYPGPGRTVHDWQSGTDLLVHSHTNSVARYKIIFTFASPSLLY